MAVVSALLFLGAPFTIVRHLVLRRTVDRETVLGAIAAYLMMGMFFAFSYRAIGAIQAGPFFGSVGRRDVPTGPVLLVHDAHHDRIRQPHPGGEPRRVLRRPGDAHRAAVPGDGGGESGQRVAAAATREHWQARGRPIGLLEVIASDSERGRSERGGSRGSRRRRPAAFGRAVRDRSRIVPSRPHRGGCHAPDLRRGWRGCAGWVRTDRVCERRQGSDPRAVAEPPRRRPLLVRGGGRSRAAERAGARRTRSMDSCGGSRGESRRARRARSRSAACSIRNLPTHGGWSFPSSTRSARVASSSRPSRRTSPRRRRRSASASIRT